MSLCRVGVAALSAVVVLVVSAGPVSAGPPPEDRLYQGVVLPEPGPEWTGAPGYDRDTWRHWVDANGDCENSRYEALRAEAVSQTATTCNTAFSGRWWDPYSRAYVQGPSGGLDVDHVVALAEAHASGGWRWSAARKEQYANFLAAGDHLIAVPAGVNRSKSDKDPAEWLPPAAAASPAAACFYGRTWAQIKVRWGLTANPPEMTALRGLLDACVVEFEDVPAGSPGAESVTWAAGNGILTGNRNRRFLPSSNLTRAAAAQAIWRARQMPHVEMVVPFEDVPSTSPAWRAIGWHRARSTMRSSPGNLFRPADRVTRAEFVYALWRAEGEPAAAPSGASDVPTGRWFSGAVDWAVAEGVVPLSGGRFDPFGAVSRRAGARFLFRALGDRFVAEVP